MMLNQQKIFFFLLFILFSSYSLQKIDKEVSIIDEMKKERLNSFSSNKRNIPINQKPPMVINSNLQVKSTLSANTITANMLNGNGNVKILNSATSSSLSVNELKVTALSVEKIKPANGVLTINGNVILTNDINLKGDSFAVKGVEQWRMISHEDFEDNSKINGWNNTKTNNCTSKNGITNTHLGGHCNFAGTEVRKVYTNLPPHHKLRVNALYHLLDMWKGEMGYMKIDGKIYWSKKGYSKENGVDFCGGDYSDPAFNAKIDVTIEHDKEEVEIIFGSTLEGDPCLHSFGVDDVMIYMK